MRPPPCGRSVPFYYYIAYRAICQTAVRKKTVFSARESTFSFLPAKYGKVSLFPRAAKYKRASPQSLSRLRACSLFRIIDAYSNASPRSVVTTVKISTVFPVFAST